MSRAAIGSGKFTPRLPRFKHLLEMEGQFTVRDVPGDSVEESYKLKWLQEHGALETHGKERRGGKDALIQVYSWKPDIRDKLKEFAKESSKLPCGHRGHVEHHPDADCYSCRYCSDNPKFDRETVEQSL